LGGKEPAGGSLDLWEDGRPDEALHFVGPTMSGAGHRTMNDECGTMIQQFPAFIVIHRYSSFIVHPSSFA
jgi:hypothetical protein